SYYKAHQSVVKGFASAYQKAANDMYADPTAAAKLVYQKYFSNQPEAPFMSSYQELIDAKILTTDPTITPSEIETIGHVYQVTSTSPIPSNWKDIFQAP
ncbi:MAG: hypothetical protein KGJ86_06945, partial [Chloroflexota bacterium]|nr:hypothetical protein [Chloroflexota bacterium]